MNCSSASQLEIGGIKTKEPDQYDRSAGAQAECKAPTQTLAKGG